MSRGSRGRSSPARSSSVGCIPGGGGGSMRGLRSTIALVVVLAGLGAYIYFVTWKKPATDAATKLEKVFPALDVAKIEEIRITSQSGDITTLKKSAGAWEVTAPIAAKADEAAAGSLA